MGLDSSAYGNYPTPFIGIFQILLKKPSYSSSNIFQIPFLRPPSQTINLRSESCLRYRCTWRREMPIFSDICVAFFGLYTNSASSTPSLRNNMRECSPLPSSQEKMPFISIRLRCSTSSSSRCNCAYLPQEQFFLILFHLIFSFCSPKPFSVHLPICVQPSLHLLLEEGSLELYHAAQAYLEQQHCWQYALGLYDFLLEGLRSVHSRSSFLPQNLLL